MFPYFASHEVGAATTAFFLLTEWYCGLHFNNQVALLEDPLKNSRNIQSNSCKTATQKYKKHGKSRQHDTCIYRSEIEREILRGKEKKSRSKLWEQGVKLESKQRRTISTTDRKTELRITGENVRKLDWGKEAVRKIEWFMYEDIMMIPSAI